MPYDFGAEVAERLPLLKRYARSLGATECDADDLVQDCVERALDRSGQFEAGTNLEAWLITILRSVFMNGKRHEKVANNYANNRKHMVEQATPPSQLHYLELKETLRACQRLSRDHQTAIVSLAIRQETHREVAKGMGTSTATAKTRLFRARAHLKELLAA